MNKKTAIERAFELAREGFTMREIRIALSRENYEPGHVYGRAIMLQLKAARVAAKGAESPQPR